MHQLQSLQNDPTLEESLSSGLVRVSFTKVDGSLREGIFTRDFSIIPPDKVPSGTGTASKTGVITVYDVQNDGWRSFRPESVISWSIDT